MTGKLIYLFLLVGCLSLVSCGNGRGGSEQSVPLTQDSTVLKVATLSRSTSYFNLQGKEMGYEYEMASKFANSLGLNLEILLAKDMEELVEMLSNEEVDLVAYPLAITNEYKGRVKFTEHEYVTNQVLVQRKEKNARLLNDVTELIGRRVFVVENSKYLERLTNLNNELGGGIEIQVVTNEEDEETLIKKVSEGEIDFTLADNNIADVNTTYYSNIDVHLKVGYDQRSAWAVNLESDSLCNVVNNWFSESKNNYIYQYLYYKYFKQAKASSGDYKKYIDNHTISIFDGLFKKYAPTIGWDWKLLASLAYQESRFQPMAKSWVGAKGLMQIMPHTALAMGVDSSRIEEPEMSVQAAVLYLKSVEKYFTSIEDEKERAKFVLASYNAGVGHVKDAMALAEKHGRNPLKWEGNVADCLLWKSNPDYFNDPVVRCGYLRGEETFRFVGEIMVRYLEYKDVIKK
ncbi:MAG: transporter substrate-binding domain-containing protein [Paludibacteraceae bacterium]|nr:transporter substrate-binding domain-containing protein [Paludibacteraceae bacterium]